MSRSRRIDSKPADAGLPAAPAADPVAAPSPDAFDGGDRTLARSVVGVTGDKAIPSWKASTTLRTRRRVFTLQVAAATEAIGAVALLTMLPGAAVDRGWNSSGLAAAAVVSALALGFAAIVGANRFPAESRVRVVQLATINGAVLTVLCGLLPWFPLTFVLVVARAAVYGLQVSAFRPLLYDAVVPEARVRAFARVAVGGLAGAVIAAFVASASYSGGGVLSGIAVAGVIALVLSFAVLRLTEPGIGGVEPARMERAFGSSPKTEALNLPMRAMVERVLLVHTVRTSLSSYVALGALGYALLHPWIVAMQTSPAKSTSSDPSGRPLTNSAILSDLGVALVAVLVVVFLVGIAQEKERRQSLSALIRGAWLYPGILGGLGALGLAVYSGDQLGALPLVVLLALALVGGTIGKVALDVSTLSVASPSDRPAVAALTNFSLVSGAALGFVFIPINAGSSFRGGFMLLALLLGGSLLFGKRLMQQPDADFDAVLPIAAAEILAETPTQEASGLTPEVSPYAYIAPPPMLDAAGRPPLLSTEKLNFAYGSVPVLFDVDVTVGEGELVAVLGPNGVGKTTLLRCLSGLEIPQQGVVRFAGEDITKTPAARRVGLGLAQIVGGNAVFGNLSVAENLQMYGFSATADKKRVQAGIARAYEVFPRLADRRNQLGSTLSGGEQQMLGLSKALILSPKLLVVDEFSLGLAPVVVAELLAMVRTLNAAGTAVLLVEQSVNVALNLVDRCYFMEKGRVIHEGAAADLQARPDLVQALSLGGMPHELEESPA